MRYIPLNCQSTALSILFPANSFFFSSCYV
uniref:Uncharacterized protein n=1 Tax=Arundo donax TaxID=35708 RepID=A0A0A8Y8W6_ARUDO